MICSCFNRPPAHLANKSSSNWPSFLLRLLESYFKSGISPESVKNNSSGGWVTERLHLQEHWHGLRFLTVQFVQPGATQDSPHSTHISHNTQPTNTGLSDFSTVCWFLLSLLPIFSQPSTIHVHRLFVVSIQGSGTLSVCGAHLHIRTIAACKRHRPHTIKNLRWDDFSQSSTIRDDALLKAF